MVTILEDFQRRRPFPLSSADHAALLDWAENVALMGYAVSEFGNAPSGTSMSAFLGQLSAGKLMLEVSELGRSYPCSCLSLPPTRTSPYDEQTVNEWGVILRDLDPCSRRKLLSLSLATEGLALADLPFNLIGLKHMLQNLLTPVQEGSNKLIFATSFHRGAMQASSPSSQGRLICTFCSAPVGGYQAGLFGHSLRLSCS